MHLSGRSSSSFIHSHSASIRKPIHLVTFADSSKSDIRVQSSGSPDVQLEASSEDATKHELEALNLIHLRKQACTNCPVSGWTQAHEQGWSMPVHSRFSTVPYHDHTSITFQTLKGKVCLPCNAVDEFVRWCAVILVQSLTFKGCYEDRPFINKYLWNAWQRLGMWSPPKWSFATERSPRQCLFISTVAWVLRRCVLGVSAALWELWRIRGVTQQPSKHLGNGILVAFCNCGRPCASQSRMREWVPIMNLDSDIAFV